MVVYEPAITPVGIKPKSTVFEVGVSMLIPLDEDAVRLIVFDVAALIVGMVKAGMEAQEITEIIERIEHLEKMLGGRVNEDE